MMQFKIVLLDEGGQVNHAQGTIKAEVMDDKHIVSRDGKLYRFVQNIYETGEMILVYHEVSKPYEITEF